MVPKLSDGNFRAFGNSTENPIALSVIGSYSTIQIASQPKNGILIVRDRQIFYTPNKDFIGDDNATVSSRVLEALQTSQSSTLQW